MTRLTCGMLTGMIGSAIGYWIWRRQFPVVEPRSRGTVVYRNTPTASEGF